MLLTPTDFTKTHRRGRKRIRKNINRISTCLLRI